MSNSAMHHATYIRQYMLGIMGVIALVLFRPAEPGAVEFRNSISLQGYTGLLNTPSAEVTDDGAISLLYSNQRENRFLPRSGREESYMFAVGLLPFAELGGRLTDAPNIGGGPGIMDLSANFKVRVPFIPKGSGLPDIAFGMQDFGGGGNHLRTSYVVATEELWRLRLSIGYGAGPNRMKGLFGGVEVQAFDWLYFLGENDTAETNLGVRLITPEVLGLPVQLHAIAKSSVDHNPGNLEFGFGVQMPLGFGRTRGERAAAPHHQVTALSPSSDSGTYGDDAASKVGLPVSATDRPAGPRDDLVRLVELLADAGFQNVRVGTVDRSVLSVEYENSRYNANELDALGVVAGIAVDTVRTHFDVLSLVIRKKGIGVLNVRAPFGYVRLLLHGAEIYEELNETLVITPDISEDNRIEYVDVTSTPAWLHSSLVLYPGLKTFVGTEVGAFDYLLSLKLDYYLNLWKGAVLNARGDLPAAWSRNFDEGGIFRAGRTGSRLERVMLFQALKVAPGLMCSLGAGMVLHDAYGTINEAMWMPGDGTHRFAFKQAYVRNRELDTKNIVYLGSYRYHYSPLDIDLVGTGGRFYDNDTGFSLELKRFFGDTSFSMYFKQSRTASQEQVQVGGVQIAFPLTPRRDMKPYLVQVRGTDEWSYSQEVKIVGAGGDNGLGTSIGVNPQPGFNLERVFYNRDRLSEDYIRTHLHRLRDAYVTYRR